MLFGAFIGLIIAFIAIAIKKNIAKKALASINDNELLDTPEYSAFFHYATEKTFKGKGFKFFNSNGALYISGNTIFYKAIRADNAMEFDLNTCKVSSGGEKRKMKWILIEKDNKKHYFTSFKQDAFNVDKSEMGKFVLKLKELLPKNNNANEIDKN